MCPDQHTTAEESLPVTFVADDGCDRDQLRDPLRARGDAGRDRPARPGAQRRGGRRPGHHDRRVPAPGLRPRDRDGHASGAPSRRPACSRRCPRLSAARGSRAAPTSGASSRSGSASSPQALIHGSGRGRGAWTRGLLPAASGRITAQPASGKRPATRNAIRHDSAATRVGEADRGEDSRDSEHRLLEPIAAPLARAPAISAAATNEKPVPRQADPAGHDEHGNEDPVRRARKGRDACKRRRRPREPPGREARSGSRTGPRHDPARSGEPRRATWDAAKTSAASLVENPRPSLRNRTVKLIVAS